MKKEYEVIVDVVTNKVSRYLKIEVDSNPTIDECYIVYICLHNHIEFKGFYHLSKQVAINEGNDIAKALSLGEVKIFEENN